MHTQAGKALLFVLLVASSAIAAPKITGDNEVKPGGFAVLTVEGAGKTAVWDVYPEPIQQIEVGSVLIFTGQPGVRYLAAATIADFEAKTLVKVRHWVTFAGIGPAPVPPQPVPPVPVPVPPTPVDPLAVAIRDAAAKDGFAKLLDLSTGFAVCVDRVDVHATGGALKADVSTILEKKIGGKVRAPALFALLAAEVSPLETLFPTDATPTTPERKQAAKAIFAKLSAACLEASR